VSSSYLTIRSDPFFSKVIFYIFPESCGDEKRKKKRENEVLACDASAHDFPAARAQKEHNSIYKLAWEQHTHTHTHTHTQDWKCFILELCAYMGAAAFVISSFLTRRFGGGKG
jgi:hypothetical protein